MKRGQSAFSTAITSVDIFWFRDESLEGSDNLPDPAVLGQEIVEDSKPP
jgi:hypothetical protein